LISYLNDDCFIGFKLGISLRRAIVGPVLDGWNYLSTSYQQFLVGLAALSFLSANWLELDDVSNSPCEHFDATALIAHLSSFFAPDNEASFHEAKFKFGTLGKSKS
jgi:hypothetical protein